jgi:hypothetical protein
VVPGRVRGFRGPFVFIGAQQGGWPDYPGSSGRLTGKITVVGSAMPTDSGPYLEDGSLTISTLWDPAKLGYLTVVLANNLLKGQTPANGQDINLRTGALEEGITLLTGSAKNPGTLGIGLRFLIPPQA